MVTALPLLSDSIQADVLSLTLPVPRPLETRGCQVVTSPHGGHTAVNRPVSMLSPAAGAEDVSMEELHRLSWTDPSARLGRPAYRVLHAGLTPHLFVCFCFVSFTSARITHTHTVCLQLCLSGLSERSRQQANAAILGVSLLMEDVLNSGREAGPFRLHGNKDDPRHDGRPNKVKKILLYIS